MSLMQLGCVCIQQQAPGDGFPESLVLLSTPIHRHRDMFIHTALVPVITSPVCYCVDSISSWPVSPCKDKV